MGDEQDQCEPKVYRCTQCNRSYKQQATLLRHQSKCVCKVSMSDLESLPAINSADQIEDGVNFFKVRCKPPEHIAKKSLQAKPRRKQTSTKGTNGEGKKETVDKKTAECILQQADQDVVQQLVMCKANEILNESIGSQAPDLTQPLKPSKLKGVAEAGRKSSLWSTAKYSSSLPYEDTRLHVHDNRRKNREAATQSDADVGARFTGIKPIYPSVIPETDSSTEFSVDLIKENTFVKNFDHQLQSIVGTRKFSDVQIVTSDGTVYAHKVLIALAYPELSCFLVNHKKIDLSLGPKKEVLDWLKQVYTRESTRKPESLPRYITEFLSFSSLWKPSDTSEHSHQAPELKKRGKGRKSSAKDKAEKKQTVQSPQSPPIESPGSDTNSLGKSTSAFKKQTKNYARSVKDRLSRAGGKYPPLISATPVKVSPLLSIIGECETTVVESMDTSDELNANHAVNAEGVINELTPPTCRVSE